MTTAIAVIGGGISGALVVLNCIKLSKKQLSIIWFDTGNNFCKGLAYSTSIDEHLLNVKANNMSLFADEPNHFVNWLSTNYSRYSSKDFVPRKIFGEYLQHVFNHLKNSNSLVTIQQIAEEVVAVDKTSDGFDVKTGQSYPVEQVVLALGNFLPAHPRSTSKEFILSENYFQNAFDTSIAHQIKNKNNITIIGSGLTMVDVLISLSQFNYNGNVNIISPHAYVPQAHVENPLRDVKPFLQNGEKYTLLELVSLVNQQLKTAAKNGFSSHSVIDVMRPYFQEIWLQFSLDEKNQFLRHLRHKWGVARHRAPQQSMNLFYHLHTTSKLKLLKGRIFEIKTLPNGFELNYLAPNNNQKKIETQLLINCTGPQSDYSQIQSPLIQYLIKNGTIAPDSINYGINADKNGKITSNLYTLGPPLKGILWESTAVPEIRRQAKDLASKII